MTDANLPSIGSMIRATIESSESFTAQEVAEAVADLIEPALYRHYLVELIVARVSSEASNLRTKVTPARKSLSTKQALIRDQYWPTFLNRQISLPSGYKRLAQATADDLRFVADARRAQANDLMRNADTFTRLAELMEKSHVKFLEQLDPASGEAVLDAA